MSSIVVKPPRVAAELQCCRERGPLDARNAADRIGVRLRVMAVLIAIEVVLEPPIEAQRVVPAPSGRARPGLEIRRQRPERPHAHMTPPMMRVRERNGRPGPSGGREARPEVAGLRDEVERCRQCRPAPRRAACRVPPVDQENAGAGILRQPRRQGRTGAAAADNEEVGIIQTCRAHDQVRDLHLRRLSASLLIRRRQRNFSTASPWTEGRRKPHEGQKIAVLGAGATAPRSAPT